MFKVAETGNTTTGYGSLYNMKDIIRKKRDGQTLTKDELDYFVASVTNHSLNREQIGAMLMAMWLKGLDMSELTHLTSAMVHSGETLKWPPEWRGHLADKHSTGGVGDKISLVLTPALASCGLKVPMISGRALGHTGGTLDKLEAISGFRVSQTAENITRILDEVGCCIVGQTDEIVPADRVLYSSRDITSTVDSLPLIASSIVSKKVAENISALVLDVKFGRAAFMKEKERARELAKTMVRVSNDLGVATTAILTSMDSPVGYMIGNALEVLEALQCLHGDGPEDVEQLVEIEGALLLHSLGAVESVEAGRTRIHDVIHDGEALQKFLHMLIGQGVKPETAKTLCTKGQEFKVMTRANHVTDIRSPRTGYIHGIEPMLVARVTALLGGARHSHDDQLNHAVGCQLNCKLGQHVQEGDVLVSVHHDEPTLPQSLRDVITEIFEILEHEPTAFHRIDDIIQDE